jgi:hypothetical protein
MSRVCSKCKKSLTIKESILATHHCSRLTSKSVPHVLIQKSGDYIKNHFSELIAAEMRKTIA